jgi:hypothetical protein
MLNYLIYRIANSLMWSMMIFVVALHHHVYSHVYLVWLKFSKSIRDDHDVSFGINHGVASSSS